MPKSCVQNSPLTLIGVSVKHAIAHGSNREFLDELWAAGWAVMRVWKVVWGSTQK